jgi:hypothetical protein
MKFEAYIICWNESAILPFILDYWAVAGVDRLIVFDNHSDEKTLELLRSYSFVEVRDFDSRGEFNDHTHADIKNNCWKNSDADWVFVGDTDEVPYCSMRVRRYLEECCADVDIIQPCFYDLAAWCLPLYNGLRLLHQTPGVRVCHRGPNKINLFRPSQVREMNFGLGAHKCNPDGAAIIYREDIAWLHCKNLGVEYLLDRNRALYNRLPEKVKAEKKIAVHYLPGTDVHNVASGLADMWAESKSFEQYPILL